MLMRFHTIPTATLLLITSALSGVAEERIAIDIAPVRWQALPDAVKSVVVGPDGRTWYQVTGKSGERSDAEIRTALENEYRQAAPQISGASIALLEPGGRAWFYVHAPDFVGAVAMKKADRKLADDTRLLRA